MKILEIPQEFKEMLIPFRTFMTGPQFKHFSRYVFGLIVAENRKKTVEGINALYAETRDRSNLTRFMIQSSLDMDLILNKALERHWKHLNMPMGVNLFLILDDSDTEKSGKHIEGAGYFRLMTNQRGPPFLLPLWYFRSLHQ